MHNHSPADTKCPAEVVELTPAGRGAVAVVLVAGAEALAIVENCFAAASGRRLAEMPLQRIVLGRFGGSDSEEVVVCRRSREQVEVHCHGGTAAVSALVAWLVELGCRRTPWQDWLRRTSGDPLQVAARIALADATTARSAAILLDQYQGALANAFSEIVTAIESGKWQQAAQAIDSVLAHRGVGMHLTSPWRVVLTGPTNVGKSSLINALAGFQRAIVSPMPGTTRDVVTTTTAIDGWPVELADTAGIRNPQDELESAGIALAETTLARADLVLLVSDASRPLDAQAVDISSRKGQRSAVFVRNKIDLLSQAERDISAHTDSAQHWQSQWYPTRVVSTSALTGEGIAELITAIAETLIPNPPAPGTAVPFAVEQIAALEAARVAIAAHDAAESLTALRPLLPFCVVGEFAEPTPARPGPSTPG